MGEILFLKKFMTDKKWFQYDFKKISSIFLTAVWLIRCWKDVVTRWERDKKCERHQPNTQREISQNFMERIVFLGFKVLIVSSFMNKNLNKKNSPNWKNVWYLPHQNIWRLTRDLLQAESTIKWNLAMIARLTESDVTTLKSHLQLYS